MKITIEYVVDAYADTVYRAAAFAIIAGSTALYWEINGSIFDSDKNRSDIARSSDEEQGQIYAGSKLIKNKLLEDEGNALNTAIANVQTQLQDKGVQIDFDTSYESVYTNMVQIPAININTKTPADSYINWLKKEDNNKGKKNYTCTAEQLTLLAMAKLRLEDGAMFRKIRTNHVIVDWSNYDAVLIYENDFNDSYRSSAIIYEDTQTIEEVNSEAKKVVKGLEANGIKMTDLLDDFEHDHDSEETTSLDIVGTDSSICDVTKLEFIDDEEGYADLYKKLAANKIQKPKALLLTILTKEYNTNKELYNKLLSADVFSISIKADGKFTIDVIYDQ